MSQVLSRSGKVLVDIDKGNPNINIPLEQLLRHGPPSSNGDGDAGAASPTAVPAPSRAVPPPARGSNDSYRSRDRESH
jgi:hypothetical protein